jgi:hypothetical protein
VLTLEFSREVDRTNRPIDDVKLDFLLASLSGCFANRSRIIPDNRSQCATKERTHDATAA